MRGEGDAFAVVLLQNTYELGDRKAGPCRPSRATAAHGDEGVSEYPGPVLNTTSTRPSSGWWPADRPPTALLCHGEGSSTLGQNVPRGNHGSPSMPESIKVVGGKCTGRGVDRRGDDRPDPPRPHAHVAVVMVIPEHAYLEDDAGGFEGPALTDKEADEDWKKWSAGGQSALERTAAVLGPDAEVRLCPTTINGGRCGPSCSVDERGRARDRLRRRTGCGAARGTSVSDDVGDHARVLVMLIRHDH